MLWTNWKEFLLDAKHHLQLSFACFLKRQILTKISESWADFDFDAIVKRVAIFGDTKLFAKKIYIKWILPFGKE